MGKVTYLFWCQTSNALVMKGFLLNVIIQIHQWIVVISRILASTAPRAFMGACWYTVADEPRSGQVELCWMGKWVNICEDDWSKENANVACRQIGYSGFGKL